MIVLNLLTKFRLDVAFVKIHVAFKPVSYSHLRTHETEAELVFRPLPEKKKTNKHELIDK